MSQVDCGTVPNCWKASARFLKKITGHSLFNKKVSEENLSELITQFVESSSYPVVIIIDEVDQAGNYEAFIKFLGLLRNKYLKRNEDITFHSVILAGVYDVKNLKLKIRSDEQHQYNSPWNIAAP